VTTPHFRAGVILVVRRADGQVLSFERSDRSDHWQLPQGGLDAGETPVAAAWRELREETGLGPEQVRLTGEHERWTVYEFPPEVRASGTVDERLGQAHRWFFFEVLDPDVEPTPDGREFVDWRWTDVDTLIAEVADFRRPGYEEALT
jgi:putative (di)nucleoside polyphosphate hydrolase